MVTKSKMAFGAAVAALATFLSPVAAHAESADNVQREVIEVPMQWDCSTFTESDRARAIQENLDMCGALDGHTPSSAPRVTTPGNCGTASMYVDRIGANTRKVSYGFHSTDGVVYYRSLNLFTPGGNWIDLGPMGSADYTNTRNVTYGTSMGGTMNGFVNVVGWHVQCSVYTYAHPA